MSVSWGVNTPTRLRHRRRACDIDLIAGLQSAAVSNQLLPRDPCEDAFNFHRPMLVNLDADCQPKPPMNIRSFEESDGKRLETDG